MKALGKEIKYIRLNRGLTQEDLASELELSLRTIQRVENGEGAVRRKNMIKIAEYFDLNWNIRSDLTKKAFSEIIIVWLRLFLVNLLFVLVIGFLTIEVHANRNSRLGALLVFITLAFLIRQNTTSINSLERLFKYATGVLLYVLLIIILHGVPLAWITMLLPTVIVFTSVLILNFNPIKSL